MNHLYTISAFTENSAGVLHRLTSVFTRRKINIESLCVSETQQHGISRFTISIRVAEEMVRKVVAQIARVIEVVKVEYHSDDELLFKEIAFFKIKAEEPGERSKVQELAAYYGGIVASVTKDFVVIEKTGREGEVNSLYLLLEPYGILEFVRSGRIAMTKADVPEVDFAQRQVVRSDSA